MAITKFENKKLSIDQEVTDNKKSAIIETKEIKTAESGDEAITTKQYDGDIKKKI